MRRQKRNRKAKRRKQARAYLFLVLSVVGALALGLLDGQEAVVVAQLAHGALLLLAVQRAELARLGALRVRVEPPVRVEPFIELGQVRRERDGAVLLQRERAA